MIFAAWQTWQLREAHDLVAQEVGLNLTTDLGFDEPDRDRFLPTAEDDQALMLLALRALYGQARYEDARLTLRRLGEARRVVSEEDSAEAGSEFIQGLDREPQWRVNAPMPIG